MIKLIKLLLKNCNTGLKIILGSLILSTVLIGIYGASSHLPLETRKEIYEITHLGLESAFDQEDFAEHASDKYRSDAEQVTKLKDN